MKLFAEFSTAFIFVMYCASVCPQLQNSVAPKTQQEEIKKRAYSVLVTKCNTCHATKRNRSIFTLENMDSLSQDIREQVFTKQKMPKGKKNALTVDEKELLKQWLSTL